MTERRETAVILGASMAGLLAARVLSERFSRVLLLERDLLGEGHRKGVPQGTHANNLSARGREILEALFPNLTAELAAEGASACDTGAEGRWLLGSTRLTRVRTGSLLLFASRPLLEARVRRRLLARSN